MLSVRRWTLQNEGKGVESREILKAEKAFKSCIAI